MRLRTHFSAGQAEELASQAEEPASLFFPHAQRLFGEVTQHQADPSHSQIHAGKLCRRVLCWIGPAPSLPRILRGEPVQRQAGQGISRGPVEGATMVYIKIIAVDAGGEGANTPPKRADIQPRADHRAAGAGD